jgi:CBS-domain-containing membrane protein
VADLPELFLQEDISVLFVVDSENEFLGAIEEMNLLRAKGADFFRRSSSPEMRDDASRPTLTAAEIMSTPRLAHDDDSIHGALVEMAHTHSRRVPVVTKTGELVGTLRDLDAMSALVAHKRNPQPK